MLIENIDPIAFSLGPLSVRWYGLFMAISILIGFHFFRRDGMRLGHSEDFLYNFAFIVVLGGVIGARLVYVATNWDMYRGDLISIIRIDQGGLSFHGAFLGGLIPGWLYIRSKGKRAGQLLDLVVPGICVGIMLVRIGNLFNQEVLGRPTELWFGRHPAQLIGSAIGLVLLIIHNIIARRRPPEGYLIWSFVFYYTLLRGLIEETIRDNPLYLWGYVNETYGIGFFTLTHLITVPLLLLAWWQRRRIRILHQTAHKRHRRR